MDNLLNSLTFNLTFTTKGSARLAVEPPHRHYDCSVYGVVQWQVYLCTHYFVLLIA